MKSKIYSVFTVLSLSLTARAQGIAINETGTAPNASAMLDIESNNRGLLIPRVNIANATLAGPITSPAVGLMVYNTNNSTLNSGMPTGQSAGFYFWTGTRWSRLGSNADSWGLRGNAGTTPATNFIGTTDAQNLIIRTNNLERMRILSSGEVSINNNVPFIGDRFTVSASGSDFGVNSYASGNALNLFTYNQGSNENVLFLTDNAANNNAALTTLHNGQGPTIFSLPEGNNNNGLSIEFPLANTGGTGVQVNSNVGGANRRGVNVIMSSTNTEAAYVGTQNGPGRVANFQHSSTTSTQPTIFASAASPNSRVINVQNSSTSTTQSAIFAAQASTGLNAVTFANAAAIWGQSAGLYGGVFQASGLSDDTRALTGIYTGAGSFDGVGVVGGATPTPGWGIGILGIGGWRAVEAIGDFTATGTKAFTIDHPLDPENKILMHYAIESPEVLNMYRGSITLDENGEAIVELPNYFSAININFTYNLTPIGGFAQLYIAEEIDNEGKFKIAGGNPNMKISWYVHAERNDVYMQQNPKSKIVEMDKRGYQVGRYFYPEGFGQPAEKAVHFESTNMKPQETMNEMKEVNAEASAPYEFSEPVKEKLRLLKD